MLRFLSQTIHNVELMIDRAQAGRDARPYDSSDQQPEYPLWSSNFGRPEPSFVKQGVCEDDELLHDCGNSDLAVFPLCDKGIVNMLAVGIEPHGDDGRHVERLPQIARPPWMKLRPRHLPDWRVMGV